MAFSNMDFNFAHFANFSFAHFKVEKKVWVNLGKITKWMISISGIYKVIVSGTRSIFARFVYKGSCGQIWVKVTE